MSPIALRALLDNFDGLFTSKFLAMTYKPFYRKVSTALRLWHWTTFIVTALLLYSVFVGKFFLNPFRNTPIIHDGLQQLLTHQAPDPSYVIAEALSASVWNWHIKYGYVLTGLFVFRIVFEAFEKPEERFFYKMKAGFSFARSKESRKAAVHFLVVRFIYILFYLLLTTIIATGLWLSFNRHSPDVELVHSVKQVHESCFYFLLLFILFHTAGVIRAERKGYKNNVSNMIHG
ncbi:MAG TPA: cytochrome b/b6 domain-containing protein, partial [Chitinophagaceae bacterium]|nr:cytochrome b/b6 domain-containing protein [Chitinophagaceae bacterium]